MKLFVAENQDNEKIDYFNMEEKLHNQPMKWTGCVLNS